jgi:hypothetical protein
LTAALEETVNRELKRQAIVEAISVETGLPSHRILDAAALAWIEGWSDPDTRTVTQFGAQEVRMPGSARKRSIDDDFYNPEASPWNEAPLNHCHLDSNVRRIIYVAPIQCGKSAAGEVAICYWIVKSPGGDIAYYWETDKKAGNKWDSRFEKILRASRTIGGILPLKDKSKFKNGAIILPHLNFRMLGVTSPDNLASDSYQREVIEEVHRYQDQSALAGAIGRTKAYEDGPHCIFVISTGGIWGDQLHEAQQASTNRHWLVKCPGCRQYHRMRTRWDKQHPELGGLRYDADGCRLPNGEYNYNLLEPTIRYQFPCGFEIHGQDKKARETISANEPKYSEPTNTGAHLSIEGYTLEGVSIHQISWLQLIQDKHEALQALRYAGDIEPWKRYIQEREAGFFNEKEIPGSQRIILNTDQNQTRDAATPETARRIMGVDKQQGKARKHEVSHLWAVIRDYWLDEDRRLHARLIWEGKLHTQEEVEELRAHYNVDPLFCGEDCGHEQSQVFDACARYGYAAFKGVGDQEGSGERKLFPHHETDENGERITVKRIYSAGEMYNAYHGDHEGKQTQNAYVPLFKFCKQSIRDRMQFCLTSGKVDFEIPKTIIDIDGKERPVSEDYFKHMEAEELVPNKRGDALVWKDFGRDVDLKACELICLIQAEMSGFIGPSQEAARVREDEIPEDEAAEEQTEETSEA